MAIGWKNPNTRPAGRQAYADNPTVHSKNTKRYGHDGSKGDFPESSTGRQPADIYRDPVPPSVAPVVSHDQVASAHRETVGFAPDGSGHHLPTTHPNKDKAGNSVGPQGASTRGVQGMAHSASGGTHGRPSPRR
ncbi:MAG: hypothetical protein ACLQO1_01670 [Steroidobacteraceae bacterium]